jgi:hypothetical protein
MLELTVRILYLIFFEISLFLARILCFFKSEKERTATVINYKEEKEEREKEDEFLNFISRYEDI